MTLTHENIELGMPVEYTPGVDGKCGKRVCGGIRCREACKIRPTNGSIKTQVISTPKYIKRKWCVLVAMVGDWVPIANLKLMEG